MYLAATDRYQRMSYARCGRGGLQLPRISLGLWQNFEALLAPQSTSSLRLNFGRAASVGGTRRR